MYGNSYYNNVIEMMITFYIKIDLFRNKNVKKINYWNNLRRISSDIYYQRKEEKWLFNNFDYFYIFLLEIQCERTLSCDTGKGN